jgi:hypothetical protein
MRFKNAAKYFDRDLLTEGYSGYPLFKGQFASYDGSQPDGSFSSRRTLSYAPGLTLPARRVVATSNERWILGDPYMDEFQGVCIRQTSKAKRVTDHFQMLTPGQASQHLALGSSSCYGYSEYLKDTVNTLSNSDYTPQIDVTLARTEYPLDGGFLRSSNYLLHVKTLYLETEGFWLATCDAVAVYNGTSWQAGSARNQHAQVAAVFNNSGVYDPVTDKYTSANVTTPALLLERIKLYDKQTPADGVTRAGDMTLLVAKTSLTPAVGSVVTTPTKWTVLAVTDYQDAWALHVQKA